MRDRRDGAKVLALLACCVGAALTHVGAASAAGDAKVVPLRAPAVRRTGASPFKLAHSDAHGVVPRRNAFGWRRAPGFSSFASAESCTASCAGPLLYHNGEVMHKEKVYLIQWEPPSPSSNGQAGTSFTALPSTYRPEIAEFAQRIAASSGTFDNVYSTDMLYGETGLPGEYVSEFGGSFRDEHLYPARKTSTCPTPTSAEKLYPPSGQPCISDGESSTGEKNFQLSDELFRYIEEKHLPTGLSTIYFMLLPHGVNTCSGSEGGIAACNTNFFCAYHSAFGIKIGEVVTPVVYANMPYDDVSGCETPDQPNKSAADDEVNTLSHEHNEAITDPLGEGWFDNQGEEVADKCTYPFFDPAEDSSPSTDAYGPLLGGTPKGALLTPGTAFNQEISGGDYLLQREWSNAAGGCVTQAPRDSASFVVSQESEKALSFYGGTSTTEAGEIVEYKWEFGDGAVASGSAVKHTYAALGEYAVTLTVKNDSGVVSSTTQHVTLTEGSGGIVTTTTTQTVTKVEPPLTTTTTATATTSLTLAAAPVVTTTTATTTATASQARVGPFSASTLARLLGLPANGAKLKGFGTISLGHAVCPPACSLKGRLVVGLKGRGRHAKRIQIGSLKMTLAGKGADSIATRLTARGRELLRHSRRHALSVMLSLVVEDQQGASWQLQRRLTLTR